VGRDEAYAFAGSSWDAIAGVVAAFGALVRPSDVGRLVARSCSSGHAGGDAHRHFGTPRLPSQASRCVHELPLADQPGSNRLGTDAKFIGDGSKGPPLESKEGCTLNLTRVHHASYSAASDTTPLQV